MLNMLLVPGFSMTRAAPAQQRRARLSLAWPTRASAEGAAAGEESVADAAPAVVRRKRAPGTINISRMTVPMLREELRKLNLSEEGVKPDLQTRLRAARGGLVSDSDSDGEYSGGGMSTKFGSNPQNVTISKLHMDKQALKAELASAHREIKLLQRLLVAKDRQLIASREHAMEIARLMGLDDGAESDGEGSAPELVQAR